MGFQSLFLKRKPTPLPVPVEPVATLIGGRRHRIDIPYLLPKDLPEASRLEYQHFFLKGVLGKNYFAPLENPVNILDVGCGTGRWCIEIAQQFPSTWVTGVDIEFHLPPVSIPTNCHFIQGNVLQRLPFSDQFFSYTHQRFLGSAIPLAYWPDAIAELKRVTAQS